MADSSNLAIAAGPVWPARIGRLLGWLLVTVLLTVMLTLLTFPFDALHTRLLNELVRQTGLTVRVDVQRPLRPLGLEWQGVRLSRGETPEMTIGKVTGQLSWTDALQGKPVVLLALWLDARAVDATVQATVTFADWNFQRLTGIQGDVSRLDLVSAVGEPVKGGRGQATFSFAASPSGSIGLDGDLRAELNDIAIAQMTQQGLRLPEWSVTSLRAGLHCQQQVCRITEFLGTGPDGSLEATGQIVLDASAAGGRWEVAVTLIASQTLSQRAAAVGGFPLPVGTPLRARIVGPLLQPQVTL